MTIQHHPTEETLLRHAAGTLGAGPSLVVETHLSFCPLCRRHLRVMEGLGGVLLEGAEAMALKPGALDRALARLDQPAPVEPSKLPPAPDWPAGIPMPAPLRRRPIGPWRWLAPGVRFARIAMPEGERAKVLLLRSGPGVTLPRHSHSAAEYTCVVTGAFRDHLGHYGPGDMSEADENLDHQPVVTDEGECITLAALEGRLRIASLLGRLAQPFLGI